MPAIIRFDIECEACGFNFCAQRRIPWPRRVAMSPHCSWRDVPSREGLVEAMVSATYFRIKTLCDNPSISDEEMDKLLADEDDQRHCGRSMIIGSWFHPIIPPRRRCPDCSYLQFWMSRGPATEPDPEEVSGMGILFGLAGIVLGILIVGWLSVWWKNLLSILAYFTAGGSLWEAPRLIRREVRQRAEEARKFSGKNRRRNLHKKFPDFPAKCPSIRLMRG